MVLKMCMNRSQPNSLGTTVPAFLFGGLPEVFANKLELPLWNIV